MDARHVQCRRYPAIISPTSFCVFSSMGLTSAETIQQARFRSSEEGSWAAKALTSSQPAFAEVLQLALPRHQFCPSLKQTCTPTCPLRHTLQMLNHVANTVSVLQHADLQHAHHSMPKDFGRKDSLPRPACAYRRGCRQSW